MTSADTRITGGFEGGRGIEGGDRMRLLAMAVVLATVAACSDGSRERIHDSLSPDTATLSDTNYASETSSNEVVNPPEFAPEDISLSTQVSISPQGRVMTVWSNVSGNFTIQWLTGPNGQDVATEGIRLPAGPKNMLVPDDAGYAVFVDDTSSATVHGTTL